VEVLGGGGGAGYGGGAGGAGGASGGGGGGGSSFAAATGTQVLPGTAPLGDGSVTITYDPSTDSCSPTAIVVEPRFTG